MDISAIPDPEDYLWREFYYQVLDRSYGNRREESGVIFYLYSGMDFCPFQREGILEFRDSRGKKELLGFYYRVRGSSSIRFWNPTEFDRFLTARREKILKISEVKLFGIEEEWRREIVEVLQSLSEEQKSFLQIG